MRRVANGTAIGILTQYHGQADGGLSGLNRFFSSFGRWINRVEEWSNLVGTWLIVFLMLLICSDVVYRTVIGASIVGAIELTELVMVGICFLPTAYM